MSERKKPAGRRRFLFGLLTGAGAVAALSSASQTATAKTEATAAPTGQQPILYRRTEESERYYRTLYR
ncbi:MAG: formate dehydrogenase [Candidatus Rokuibacteriota bacterium]